MITNKETVEHLLELVKLHEQSDESQRGILSIIHDLTVIQKSDREANKNLIEAMTIMGRTVDKLLDCIKEINIRLDRVESFIDDLKLERQK